VLKERESWNKKLAKVRKKQQFWTFKKLAILARSVAFSLHLQIVTTVRN